MGVKLKQKEVMMIWTMGTTPLSSEERLDNEFVLIFLRNVGCGGVESLQSQIDSAASRLACCLKARKALLWRLKSPR